MSCGKAEVLNFKYKCPHFTVENNIHAVINNWIIFLRTCFASSLSELALTALWRRLKCDIASSRNCANTAHIKLARARRSMRMSASTPVRGKMYTRCHLQPLASERNRNRRRKSSSREKAINGDLIQHHEAFPWNNYAALWRSWTPSRVVAKTTKMYSIMGLFSACAQGESSAGSPSFKRSPVERKTFR